LNIYEVQLRQESPVLVSGIAADSRYLKHSTSYIEGYTLRGALLTYISRELKKDVKEEALKPTIIFHPAYPTFRKEVSRPAHPLLLCCKVCREDKIFPSIDSIEKIRDFDINELFKVTCRRGHLYTVSNMKGELVVKIDKTYYKLSQYLQSLDSTAINKYVKSSEIGMLFGYLTLLPVHEEDGQLKQNIFIGKIVDTENKLENLLEEEDFEIKIGRGKSKGFGKFNVHIKLLENYVEKRTKIIENVLQKTNNIIMLRSLSLSFGLEINNHGIFTNLKLDLDAKPHYVLKDKNYLLTGIKTISGFSLKVAHGGIPKPRISGAAPGSLFFYEINTDKANYLAEKELKGFGPLSYGGLNILEVVTDV